MLFDSFERNAELVGNFALRPFVDLVHDENVAAAGRQRVDGTGQHPQALAAAGDSLGVARAVVAALGQLVAAIDPSAAAGVDAVTIDRPAGDHLAQEGERRVDDLLRRRLDQFEADVMNHVARR